MVLSVRFRSGGNKSQLFKKQPAYSDPMTRQYSRLMTGLIAVLLVLTAGIAGCTSQAPAAGQPAATPAATVIATESPAPAPATTASATPPVATTVATPASHDYSLLPSEIPGNFTLAEKRERQASELSEWAIGHGWTKGYTVTYRKNDPSAASATIIMQNISVYSKENATLAVSDTIDGFADSVAKENNANLTVEKLTITKIGDASGSLKYSDKSDNSGRYVIAFAKNGVFMDIETYGSAADYETAKQMAAIAAEKIP